MQSASGSWNAKEFKRQVEAAKTRGVLGDGIKVSSCQNVYEELSKGLNVSVDTIKQWAKSPMPNYIDGIEKIMGLPPGTLTVRSSISDFDKSVIRNCCEAIKEYLGRRTTEDKAASFEEMCNEVENQRRYVNDDLYQKVKKFIENEIKPLEEAVEEAVKGAVKGAVEEAVEEAGELPEFEPYTIEYWENMAFDDWMEKEISPLFK